MPRPEGWRRLHRRFLVGGPALVLAARVRAEDKPVQRYAPLTIRPALDAALALYRADGRPVRPVYAPTPVLVRQLAGGAPADC